jgi:hypothetical protein
MKRYECPSCHTKYHVEPAECPACMWANDGEHFMIDNDPNGDLIVTKSAAVAKAVAIDSGFASYNDCPHLCVDVPDGFFTISARLSDGRRITFAFAPYEKDSAAQCVDIHYHDSCKFVHSGKRGIPIQDVILFDRGHKHATPEIVTNICLLLYNREPVE